MRRTVPVALALVLAGCAAPAADVAPTAADGLDTAAPLASLAEIVPFETVAEDGTALRGHVYLPEGKGPFAVVLELSPYWGANRNYGPSDGQAAEVDGRQTLARPSIAKFLEAGFAVALVNLRGTGVSGGCFQFGSELDWSDAYAVVEALAAEPWSDGNVGMTGLSYPGWTQFMALAAKPPHLKAVVPSSGIIDPWNLWGRNGVAKITLPATTFRLLPTGAQGGPGSPPPDPEHVACEQYAGDAAEDVNFFLHGDRTPYWEERDLRPHIAGTTVPTFVTNGMNEGHQDQFEGLWDLLAGPKRMMIGDFGHAYPDSGSPTRRSDFPDMAVAWMDQYLRGGPERVPAGVVEYEDDTGAWHVSTSWPPAGTNLTIYLSDAGRLVTHASEVGASEQVIVGPAVFWPEPYDCSSRFAIYATPPLANDVLLAGHILVNLTITSDLPEGNIAAFLLHREALLGCDELTKWLESPWTGLAAANGDLRHARGDDRGSDFPTNTPTGITLHGSPYATPAKAGERLFVIIAAGDAGRQTPGPGSPRLTVSTGPGLAGGVTILVVEGTLAFDAGATATQETKALRSVQEALR